jgi:hypothetical protein
MGIGQQKETPDRDLWIATEELSQAPGDIFYRKVTGLWAERGELGLADGSTSANAT